MEKEVKTNENGKNASKVVIVISVVVILAVLAFWGVLRLRSKQAEKKVTTILSELKNGNMEVISEHLTSEDLEELGIETDGETVSEAIKGYKKLFNSLEYKVKKSQANFNNAKIEIEISNKNIGQAMNNYFKKSMQLLFQSALSDDDDSEEELTKKMGQYLDEELSSDSIEKVTKNITIELSKENGEWALKTEGKDIVDAVLPGFADVMKNFGNLEEDNDEILPDGILNENTEIPTEGQGSNVL